MKSCCRLRLGFLVGAILLPVLYGCPNPDPGPTDYGRPVTALWARTVAAGVSAAQFTSVAAGTDGSVLAAGVMYGTGSYDFGESVTAAGTASATNVVLVKYDASGTAQWARTLTGGSPGSQFNSVAADSGGSLYAAGLIDGTGTYTFGGSASAAAAGTCHNLVLVKYSSSGQAQWARTGGGGTSPSQFYAVAVSTTGDVYAAGAINGTVTYDFGGSITAAGTALGTNVVLVKYNSSGEAQWARTVIEGNAASEFYSVAVSPGGDVYAAGDINGTGTYKFGGVATAAGACGGANVVLVKYDASGTAQWARTVSGGTSSSEFTSVAVDPEGNVRAAGSIYGTGTYGFGGSVTAAGTYADGNVVLVKYDPSGTARWARTVNAGASLSQFSSVAVDSTGCSYAAGTIGGPGTYDFGGSVQAAGACSVGDNVVLVKYDPSGTAQWGHTVCAALSSSQFWSVAVDRTGNVYAGGLIMGTGSYDFGGSTTAAGCIGSANVLLVKYGSD